jgi:hypothetical protein
VDFFGVQCELRAAEAKQEEQQGQPSRCPMTQLAQTHVLAGPGYERSFAQLGLTPDSPEYRDYKAAYDQAVTRILDVFGRPMPVSVCASLGWEIPSVQHGTVWLGSKRCS